MKGGHRFIHRGLLLLGGGLWAICASAQADTIELGAVADTTLFERDPDFNFGAQSDVPSGTLGSNVGETRSRMLIKFDPAGGVPAGATITGATLRLSVTVSPPGRANSTFGLHRVEFDWEEGVQSGSEPGGALAVPGETTWNHRFHPTTGWDEPGGDLGADFANETSAEATVFGNGTYLFVFGENGLGDLADMVSNPGNNFGWALISFAEQTAKTARRWGTREHPALLSRPLLVIDYELPPPPPVPEIVSVDVRESDISVRFNAVAGYAYSIETDPELEGAWSPGGSIASGRDDREEEFVLPRGDSERLFFRLVASDAGD